MDKDSAERRLQSIAEELRAGIRPSPSTVSGMLAWFGVQRRGIWIVKQIKRSLKKAGLQTIPDFESALIDSPIQFILREKSAESAELTQVPTASPGTETSAPEVPNDVAPQEASAAAATISAYSDPTYRISRLDAANRLPLSVVPDATLKQAVTFMLLNDFSQLPVMSGRNVRGMVSWRSIGGKLALGSSAEFVREVMDSTHQEIRSSASIFEAIPIIVRHSYVLIRGSDNQISGIVTASDLSQQFLQLTEPFLLLGEIENHIRRIIDKHFSADNLAQIRDPADSSRAIEDAADLSFGEYVRLLQHPERWSRLSFMLDREPFCRKLDHVRDIRNDVMHFDPHGIPAENLTLLREFAEFLQRLQGLLVR